MELQAISTPEVQVTDIFGALPVEELEFNADGLRLRGTLHLPANRPAPLVIGCHGLLSDRRSPKQLALAEACQGLGMAYFRFDHRGCGESEGRLERDTSLDERHSDLLHALRHLYRRFDIEKRLGLFGSSLGGAVCIRAAVPSDAIALVTFAAPVRSRTLTAALAVRQANGGVRSLLKTEFDLGAELGGVRNILVFHGDADGVVLLDHAREIFEKAGDPKRLIIQKDGDHLMSDPRHQAEFIREAANWLQRALGFPGS
jgi:alpha-beta hydrolase superfamily lysophospholipase